VRITKFVSGKALARIIHELREFLPALGRLSC
jgi:hypothetical protein